jgi:cyclophilin family peptidyl-prolyl cis-trans isomerase/HEAT repeat protein
MQTKPVILTLVIIMFACSSVNQQQMVTQIKNLEYSRTDSTGVFERYVENGNLEVKIKIIEAIAKIQHPAHLSCLQKLLINPDPVLINKIIFALGQIHCQQSMNILTNLYVQDRYKPYLRQIIRALGKMENRYAADFVAEKMSSLADSVLDEAIIATALLFPRDSVPDDVQRKITDLLGFPSIRVVSSAAYFFTRHPDLTAAENLIRCILPLNGSGYKYRLRALQRILDKDGIKDIDSLALASLKAELTSDNTFKKLAWTTTLYRLSLLANFPDSLSATILSVYLRDAIPHLRTAAIHALGKMKTRQSMDILMSNYDRASWSDKGETLYALAESQPQVVELLVQNNLDKGTPYFKRLLLEALAKIGNTAAVQQLRQFLNVPDKRLVYSAYTGIAQCNQLQSVDILQALFSGDLALVATAAEGIMQHPQWCSFQDLEKAYLKLSEPDDIEAMISLLQTGLVLDSLRAIPFLRQVATQAESPYLVNQAIEMLTKAGDKNPPPRKREKFYVVAVVKATNQLPEIVISTEKGDIEVELWPDLAPATVANFISLIKKNFYNNLTFHRVVSDFVIQGGDPRGDGWGGPGYAIPCEYNEAEFKRGTIGMATAGKDTGGSQFFICHSEQPHLNGKYTAFGCVKKGMEIVDIIEIDDKILEITIKSRGEL